MNDKALERLFESLKSMTRKNHMDNYSYETRVWSKGYSRAMKDIDKILDSFMKESYV